MGMETWPQATIRSILTNEKYCGDVLYQKTFSKDYLSHKSVKNKDILPQWFWENNHPAIIKREQWAQAQEILASGKWGKRGKALSAIKKKFTLAKVKSGVLCGYFLLDMDWTQEEREQFINIINSINELDDGQDGRS
jgi:site-specific DNA recombinase